MADEPNVAPATDAPVFTPTIPDAAPVNARDAGRAIADARAKAMEPEPKAEQPRVNGRFASADAPKESPLEGADAGPDDPVPGENAEPDPAETPPIDPPRSWSKEDKELFNALPRETQERVAERERSRESDFLRRQNEATEKSKALEAKEQAADQARQQYETAAQNALQVLQQQQASEFSDIKTHADVQKLATDDPFRFAQWQARQMVIQAQAHEVESLNRQRQETESKQFEAWSKEQDAKFEKQFPEFADSEKGKKITASLQAYLTKEVGVPEDVLPNLRKNPVFRDAMFQRILYDGMRFHAAQQAAKSAVAAPKPPVQRPGTTPQRGAGLQAEIASAADKLNTAKGSRAIDAAAELMAARRRLARR